MFSVSGADADSWKLVYIVLSLALTIVRWQLSRKAGLREPCPEANKGGTFFFSDYIWLG